MLTLCATIAAAGGFLHVVRYGLAAHRIWRARIDTRCELKAFALRLGDAAYGAAVLVAALVAIVHLWS